MFDPDFDEEFERFFQAEQQRKWESGEYRDPCANCSGEDCVCCEFYNERD